MAGEQLSFGFDLPPARGGRPAEGVRKPEPSRPPPSRFPAAPRPKPFNYTDAMREVVRDIVATIEELRHIDPDRVLLSLSRARQASRHGVYASCVPLRGEGGAPEIALRGRRFRIAPIRHEGREMLYLLYFMLPRFHEEQEYREKLATVIHELYHISPEFNGDLRRFAGKNFAHGRSREVYHAAMQRLADRYLAAGALARRHDFLRVPFSELLARPGGVVGLCVPRPRLEPVDPEPARSARGRR